jgi:hypothetical protein
MAALETSYDADTDGRCASSAGLSAKSRRLIFNTAPVKIALNIQRGDGHPHVDVDGTLQIDGKYFPSRDVSVDGFSVQLTRDDDAVARATIEDDGAFSFREVTPGHYGVKFYTKRIGFHLRPVSLSLQPIAGGFEG